MLKEFITGNTLSLIIAIILIVVTVLVIRAIIYLVFVKDKKDNDTKKPAPKKKKDDFAHCELNDIMGYDFIQIQRIEQKEPEEVPVVEEKEKSFADSKGIGLTERMGTTGREGYDFEGEMPVDIDKARKNREIEKQNEELANKAREEGMTEISNDVMEALASTDWPDNTMIDPNRDNDADFLFGGTAPDEIEDTSGEDYAPTPEQALAAEPQEKEKHDSLINSIFEKELKELSNAEDLMLDNTSSKEGDDLFEKLKNVGKKNSVKTSDSEKSDEFEENSIIDKNDIPDID